MNENSVCVQVDREERPDDHGHYMTYVQASTGGGASPRAVWLPPALTPFVGGTYFPPEDRYGRPGFATVLHRIAEAWNKDREKIIESSRNLLERLRKDAEFTSGNGIAVSKDVLNSGFLILRRTFDSRRGG